MLLGGALTPCATSLLLNNKKLAIKKLCERLHILPSHYAFHIHRQSINTSRLMFILRSSPSVGHAALSEIDDIFRSQLSTVLNIDITDETWNQASLPINKGGLGINKTTRLALPAYISSVVNTRQTIQQIWPSYNNNATFRNYIDTWSAVATKDPPLADSKQRAWDIPLCAIQFNSLLDRSDIRNQARLQATSSKNASDWLKCTPSSKHGLTLTDEEFRYSVSLRLGLPVFYEHVCKCGEIADPLGVHSFKCRRND